MKKIKLKISENLENILNQINSPISKLLLSNISQDLLLEDHIDYLDISNADNSKISYLNIERLNKILEREMNIWTSYNLRYQSKPGSLLGKIFKPNTLNNKVVEDFSNHFKSIVNKERRKLSVVEGNDIKFWYDGDNYSNDGCGSLNNSCMKYESCQDFLDFYLDNNLKMVILTQDNLLVGRALLWEATDEDGNCLKVMDRIYTIDDGEFLPTFKEWAKNNNYLYRQTQNWNNPLFWIQNDQVVLKKMEIQLKNWINYSYPYLDTFKFFDRDNGILYNYIPSNFYQLNSSILISTDGCLVDNMSLVLDDIDLIYISRDQCHFLQNENIYTSYDNLVWSDIIDRYILKTDATYNDLIEDYIYFHMDRNPPKVIDYLNKQKIEDLRTVDPLYLEIN